MNKYADLHIHTTASDGEFSPSEVVKMAKEKGFSAIAITDHDTLDGLKEALIAAEKYDLEVITGVEISTILGDEEIHILGYFVDINNKELKDKLLAMKSSRAQRIKKMVMKLNDLDYDISLDKVLEISGGGAVGRPHIAKALLEKNYVRTIKEAFVKLLCPGCPAYVPRYKITPKEAIQLIKNAQGIPVIAHPGICHNDHIIGALKRWGLRGVEVWHPEHTENMAKKYQDMAYKYRLLITGGSDWHGSNKDENFSLGNVKLDYKYVQKLKNKI